MVSHEESGIQGKKARTRWHVVDILIHAELTRTGRQENPASKDCGKIGCLNKPGRMDLHDRLFEYTGPFCLAHQL